MRKILTLFILLLSLKASTQNTFEVNYKYTAVFGKCMDWECESSNTYSEDDSIIEKPTVAQEKRIIDFIAAYNNKAIKREVTVYDSFGFDDELTLKLDSIELNRTQVRYDTIFTGKKKKIAQPIIIKYDYKNVALLRLTQEWYYHANTNKLDAVVNNYSPVFAVYGDEGYYKGLMPMYYNKLQSIVSYNNQAAIISDTSISWAKRFKFQIPVTYKEDYPSLVNRDMGTIKKVFDMELANILLAEAKKNKLEVYHPKTGEKLDLLTLQQRLQRSDTMLIENEKGVLEMRVNHNEADYESLSSLIINQTFIFDEKNFTIKSKINSIIVTAYIGFSGELTELFEVRFKD